MTREEFERRIVRNYPAPFWPGGIAPFAVRDEFTGHPRYLRATAREAYEAARSTARHKRAVDRYFPDGLGHRSDLAWAMAAAGRLWD